VTQGVFLEWEKRRKSESVLGKRLAARGAIFLSFIVALEIAIMISPFAFFSKDKS
jgi:hypothetical protein